MSEIRIGAAQAGRTVAVAAGDHVVVALPEIGGTGYTWQVEALPRGAELVDERYEHSGPGIGATAQHVFVIAPGGGGEIRLRQARPWLGDEGVIDRYAVSITAG